MSVAGRFTYATLPALASFYEWQAMQSWGSNLKASTYKICFKIPDLILYIAELSQQPGRR